MPSLERFFSRLTDLLQHKSDELPPEGPSNSEAVSSQYDIAVPSVPQYSSSEHHLPTHNGAFVRQAESTANHIITHHDGLPSHQNAHLQSALVGIQNALPTTNYKRKYLPPEVAGGYQSLAMLWVRREESSKILL